MKVEIQDAKLVDILTRRGEIHKKIGEINEQLITLDKERKVQAYKMDKLKDKTKAIMDKLNPELQEFEFIARVYLENGKAYYDIEDMIEEYKSSIREDRKNKQTV